MRHLDFDELWKNHLFDYKDGDLLVIDDITRLNLSDYEDTAPDFVVALFCAEGRLMLTIEDREYRIGEGCLFVYLPGQTMNSIMLSQNAKIKVIAFARRAIDRSLYLNKYVWQQAEYIRKNPIFQLNERERLITGHYCSLMILKTQGSEGSFHHDVVRMLFQTLMMEFMMLVERKRETLSETDSVQDSKDAIVRQSTLIYHRFMSLLAESAGRVRSVSAFANMLNVTPKYLSKCVKEESGHAPLDLIHENTITTIRQQLRYSNKTVKEICTELDFPNLSFFGKFVREHMGMSPTEYRQQNLNNVCRLHSNKSG